MWARVYLWVWLGGRWACHKRIMLSPMNAFMSAGGSTLTGGCPMKRSLHAQKIAACTERKELEALLAASRTHKAGERCWVQGVTDSPEMNGHEVMVMSETPVFELLQCKKVSGREIRVRPCNLQRRGTCSHCNASYNALKNCAKCGVTSYCGKACQVAY